MAGLCGAQAWWKLYDYRSMTSASGSILRLMCRNVSTRSTDLKGIREAVRARPASIITNNDLVRSPKRTWNVTKGVQSILRQDVLCGPGFHETVFKNTYPVVHKEYQEMLIDRFLELNPAEKKEFLTKIEFNELKSFMRELLLSHIELQDRDGNIICQVCFSCLDSASLSECLLLTDMLYVLGILNDAHLRALFERVLREWPSPFMDSSKLLQLFFYIGIYRNAPPRLLDNIESYLENIVKELSASEIGLMCHAFFSCNHAINNYRMMELIAQQTLKHLDRTPLYLVCNIMKALNHGGYSRSAFYDSLGKNLCALGIINANTHMSNLSNIISSFASRRHSHPQFFETVSNSATKIVQRDTARRPRLKDLARIIWSCANLRLPVPGTLVQELKRQVQQDVALRGKFPQAFMEALLALAMVNVYIYDQISYVLDIQFEEAMSGKNFEQHYQRLLIDSLVQLECPDYQGVILSQSYVAEQVKCRDRLRGLALNTRQGLAVTWLTLEELLGGPSFIKCHFITNFTRISDLEVRINVDGYPLDWCPSDLDSGEKQLRENLRMRQSKIHHEDGEGVLADLLREKNKISVRKAAPNIHLLPKGGNNAVRKITVKLLSENQYVANTPDILGIHQLELRALTAVGYEVLLINPRDAARIEEAAPEERVHLVKSLILSPLKIKT